MENAPSDPLQGSGFPNVPPLLSKQRPVSRQAFEPDPLGQFVGFGRIFTITWDIDVPSKVGVPRHASDTPRGNLPRPQSYAGSMIEVVQIGRTEPSTPAAEELEFPESSKDGPDLRGVQTGYCSHTQVSRHRGALDVTGKWCIRIEDGLMFPGPETRDDPETRPTNPGGGKSCRAEPIKRSQIPSQVRVQNPPSCQATMVIGDPLR